MTKYLRRLAIALLLFGTTKVSYAENVNLADAYAIASKFINSMSDNNAIKLGESPVYIAGTDAKPLYYVFNATDKSGFVIVSAQSVASPVLGYSFEGAYPVDAVPEAMQWVMSGIERELKSVSSATQSEEVPVSERLMYAQAAAQTATETQKVLTTVPWSQEVPFNSMIPGCPLVGCVGTAMATIMKYHQWPKKGSGSYGGVDFNVDYDWASMRNDNYRSGYTQAEANAVATIMYHVSKSIDTQYSMSGSSAYEVRVPGALSTYFGYDPGVSYKKRSDVTTQEAWDKIVKDEIDAGRPVLYCGQDVTAGHAFVCDGYQGEYLHFNWGWGGSANGFFKSTALNPTVSRTHNYNNLNTIIYNIKPAVGAVASWSPVHITADGGQVGIGSDLTDLASRNSFTLRVGNLKNLSYTDFSGKIAVALCGGDGKMKALLSTPAAFKLPSMATLGNAYMDFRNCVLPVGISATDSDKMRVMTLADGDSDWLPVAGELSTVNELDIRIDTPASFLVTLPSVAGAKVEGASSVIRGWNYSFSVTPENPAENVVTVKANGFVLTPSNGYNYTINNVCSDQLVSVLVQKASDVKEKRSVWVGTPGTLSSIISDEESGTIKELTLFGTIDARDFSFIRTAMRLTRLDISGARISAHGSDQANAIPREAFRGIGTLNEVVLPNSVNRMNNGCFRQCGITTITIPASVNKYEYNVFCAASKLRHIYVGRETAEFINWCVLSGVKVNEVTLHVPNEKALANYKKTENWNTIANIIVDPIQPNSKFTFAVMDNPEVKFETAVNPGVVEKGTQVNFTASHIAENDNRMEVYANTTLLTADESGVYHATVNDNTIIHLELVAPTPVDSNKSWWTLTAKNGSIGMFTDVVNVIPGVDFTIRVNALNIPAGFDQLFWAAALTDASGNIKEFISPVTIWTGGAGDGMKMNVACCVKSATVRQGNTIRIVTSVNKKVWNLVYGADDTIVDALPAINNVTPIYNINIPNVPEVTITGAVSSAVRGRDITLKIVPKSPANRIDLIANEKEVVKGAASVNYTFVAMSDMNFDIKVYDPKEYGSVTYNVKAGELYKAVTAETVRPHVIVVGETYASDLSAAFTQLFAQKTVKKLDLSGLKIIANGGNDANVLPAEMFYKSSGIGQSVPAIEEIILPNSVERIEQAAFKNCANIKDITLPESLISVPIETVLASGGKKYTYGIGMSAFAGCTSLNTIRIPGKPGERNGKLTVAHHNPYNIAYYDLGHADPSKVTIVVPKEYLSVYRTVNNDNTFGNVWKKHGYNILAEYPVYGFTYDPTRVTLTDDKFDVAKAVSFLGDNVKIDSAIVEDKIKLAKPEIACRVFDNGKLITPTSDGLINVVFYNPAKRESAAGNHDIKVVYTYSATFKSTSKLLSVSTPEVVNESDYKFESFASIDSITQVLKNVAENSVVRFKVSFASEHSEHSDGLEVRVMAGVQELTADEEGYYVVEIAGADKVVEIYAMPVDGASLNEDELLALDPSQSSGITSLSLVGPISPEVLIEALKNMPQLETIDLSGLVGELPDGLLAGMTNLTTVVLPPVTTIGANMFSGCTSLQSIDIPSSVNVIGEGAFKNCSSLETIRLIGITSVGAGAFDGCKNLTTITILAGGNALGTRAESAFDAHAFDGVNPNCIIVLDEGVATPSAVANYILTSSGEITETLPDGSVIKREGRIYTANSNIILHQGYPLAIPHTFTLVNNAAISLETIAEKWAALVVPFDVKNIADVTNKALTIYQMKSATDKPTASGCLLYTLPDNGETLQSVDSMKANIPYMFLTPKVGKVVLSATDSKVPATPAEIAVNGKDYSLHAVYAEAEMSASEAYLLSDDATALRPAGAQDETVTVAPFEVYATSQTSANEIATHLPSAEIYSSVDDEAVVVSDMKIVKEGTSLVIYSSTERVEKIYAIDGRLALEVKLNAGRNVITLAPGIYVIADTKILF